MMSRKVLPMEKKTWSERLKVILQFVLLVAAGISIAQQFYASRDYDRLKDEMDAQNAYRTVGLKNAAESAQFVAHKSQEALKQERAQYAKLLVHCQQHPCELPPDLAVQLPEPVFQNLEPIENILLKEHQ